MHTLRDSLDDDNQYDSAMPLNIPILTTERTSKGKLPIENITLKNQGKKTKTVVETDLI